MYYDYIDAHGKMLDLVAAGKSNFVKIAKEDMNRLETFSNKYNNDLTLEIKKSADRNYMLCRYKIND